MMEEVIGARFTPDIFGGTQELTLTFTWDTPMPPPEVYAIHDAFMAGEPFPVSIGNATARYSPLDFSQDIATSKSTTLSVRLKRIDDPR